MRIKKLSTPFGYTIFCEDIRVERDDRFSFIGVHPAVLTIADDFPVTFPKISFSVNFLERTSDPHEDLEILIFLPDDKDEPSIRHAVDRKASVKRGSSSDLGEDPLWHIAINFQFSLFTVHRPSTLRVRMKAGDTLHRCGSLLFRKGS